MIDVIQFSVDKYMSALDEIDICVD